MKIVVEGYDASGKSTLARALAEKLGLVVVEAGPKPPSDLDAIADGINQLRMTDTVHSRITPISRRCYQFDISRLHHDHLEAILLRFEKMGAIFIYCTGKSDIHEVKQYDTIEHLRFLEKHEVQIRHNYDTLFTMIPHLKYNFHTDSLEELVCDIRKMLSLS